MTNPLDRYVRLKREAEEARSQADKMEGAYKHVIEEIRVDFHVSGLAEAETLLQGKKAKQQEAKENLVKEMDSFEKKWKGKLCGA